MTTIDIRKGDQETITEIVFHDDCSLTKNVNTADIKCGEGVGYAAHYSIEYKEEAENLIKALQKALELGWFDD